MTEYAEGPGIYVAPDIPTGPIPEPGGLPNAPLRRDLAHRLLRLEHLRDLCLQYMNAKRGEEDERCHAIFDYLSFLDEEDSK